MEKNGKRRLAITAAALLLAAAGTLLADVFRPVLATHADFLSAIGGRAIYTSEAEVNGAAATLTAYGFDRPLSDLKGELRKRPSLANNLARQESKHLYLLATGVDKSVAFLVDYRDRPRPKAQVDWPDMPQPAGAEPLFSATLAATRTTVVRATMPAAPAQAATITDAALQAKGWRLAAPATSSLALYQRRNATMTVLTLPADTPGTTALTMLQRLGAAAW